MILDDILKRKREEVAERRRKLPLEELRERAAAAPPQRDFRRALAERDDVALIAELKRRSPSAGVIRADFDPTAIATAYHAAGAAALSVLTDADFFGGQLEHLADARAATPLPVLRKDFIIDPYQLWEARAAGADAVLLIVRILTDAQLAEYLALADALGMAALVEVHSLREAERGLRSGAAIIGINNRNLATMTVDLSTTPLVARELPRDRIIVSESGIASRRDVELLAANGVNAVLVGESLLRSADLARAARSLVGVPRLRRI